MGQPSGLGHHRANISMRPGCSSTLGLFRARKWLVAMKKGWKKEVASLIGNNSDYIAFSNLMIFLSTRNVSFVLNIQVTAVARKSMIASILWIRFQIHHILVIHVLFQCLGLQEVRLLLGQSFCLMPQSNGGQIKFILISATFQDGVFDERYGRIACIIDEEREILIAFLAAARWHLLCLCLLCYIKYPRPE